ncbi:MAG: hypothetical protein SFZ23_11465 [Planctomycetota bacterium]|nr:hypothetical protein [Planctomycetota bacterium]
MTNCLLALAAATTLAPSASLAQCTDIYVWGVPDFDQRRSSLPNLGNCYCVPTAALNWMGYYANHGVGTAMWASNANWQFANYVNTSNRLLIMGDFMDTDPDCGTGLGDALSGIIDYLDEYTNRPFMAQSFYANGNSAPTPKQFAAALRLKWQVMMHYGRYDLDGTEWERDGGHAVTLVGVRNNPCGSNPIVQFNDPWTGGSDSTNTQSSFSFKEWELVRTTRNFDGEVRAMWEPRGQTGTVDRRFIDKRIYIIPLFALTGVSTSVASSLKMTRLNQLDNDESDREVVIPSPNGNSIVSAISDLEHMQLVVVTAASRTQPAALWTYSLADEAFSGPLTEFGGTPAAVDSDRFGNVFVLESSRVTKWRMGDGSVTPQGTVTLPYVCDALTINDANDDLFVVAGERRRILKFTDGNLGVAPQDQPVPTGAAFNGIPCIAPNPATGRLFLTSENGSAYEISQAAGAPVWVINSTIPMGSFPNRKGLQFSDRGVMQFISNGVVRELALDPLSGRWIANPIPLFTGGQASDFITLGRSRTNFNPAKHATLGYRFLENPDPTTPETPVCLVDVNGDGVVDFFDYLDFAQFYAASSTNADFNFDGSVDFFDYLDFVAAYDAGC